MPDVNSNLDNIPPSGDAEKAEKYLSWLTDLVGQDKINVSHTDLKKFDPNSMQDHYQMIVKNVVVEVSHSRNPNTDKDSYIILFNNMQEIAAGTAQKVILAYIPLTEKQFKLFKFTADEQIERYRRAEEERKFKAAMAPVDKLLMDLSKPADTKDQPELIETVKQETINPVERPTLTPIQA